MDDADKMCEADGKDPIADVLKPEFTEASKEMAGDKEKDKSMEDKSDEAFAKSKDEKEEKKEKSEEKDAACGPMAKRPGPWMDKKDTPMAKKASLMDRTPGSYLEKR